MSDERIEPSREVQSSRIRRWCWWMLYIAAWGITLSLLAAASLRIFYHDGTRVLVQINAFTRYVYLPAYVVLAWAVWQRRWALGLTNIAVVACHLMWMAPDFVRDRRYDVPSDETIAGEGTSQPLRVFFANVRGTNRQCDALLREIEAAKPDIVAMAEVSQYWYAHFKASPVMAPYIYGKSATTQHSGLAVFSKIPLNSDTLKWVGSRPIETIEIPLGSRTMRLITLHAVRPEFKWDFNYYDYWKEALPILLAQNGPVVVVGDFNVTEHAKVYRQLTSGRLRSAHEDRGRGWATTWPNGEWLLPPIRIDQAFLSPEIECLEITEGIGKGSDHKPLIFDVRLRPAQVSNAATAHTASGA